jgi:hypothetical protein
LRVDQNESLGRVDRRKPVYHKAADQPECPRQNAG